MPEAKVLKRDVPPTYTIDEQEIRSGFSKRTIDLSLQQMFAKLKQLFQNDPGLSSGKIITAYEDPYMGDEGDWSSIDGSSFGEMMMKHREKRGGYRANEKLLVEGLVRYPDRAEYKLSSRIPDNLERFMEIEKDIRTREGDKNTFQTAKPFWWARFSSARDPLSPPRRLLEDRLDANSESSKKDGSLEKESFDLRGFQSLESRIPDLKKDFFVSRKPDRPVKIHPPKMTETGTRDDRDSKATQAMIKSNSMGKTLEPKGFKWNIIVQGSNHVVSSTRKGLTKIEMAAEMLKYVKSGDLESGMIVTAYKPLPTKLSEYYKGADIVSLCPNSPHSIDTKFNNNTRWPYLIETLINHSDNLVYTLNSYTQEGTIEWYEETKSRKDATVPVPIAVHRLSASSNDNFHPRLLIRKAHEKRDASHLSAKGKMAIPLTGSYSMILKDVIPSRSIDYFVPSLDTLTTLSKTWLVVGDNVNFLGPDERKPKHESSYQGKSASRKSQVFHLETVRDERTGKNIEVVTGQEDSKPRFTLLTTTNDDTIHEMNNRTPVEILKRLKDLSLTDANKFGRYPTLIHPSQIDITDLEDYNKGFVDKRTGDGRADWEVKAFELDPQASTDIADDQEEEGRWYKYDLTIQDMLSSLKKLFTSQPDPETGRLTQCFKFQRPISEEDKATLLAFLRDHMENPVARHTDRGQTQVVEQQIPLQSEEDTLSVVTRFDEPSEGADDTETNSSVTAVPSPTMDVTAEPFSPAQYSIEQTTLQTTLPGSEQQGNNLRDITTVAQTDDPQSDAHAVSDPRSMLSQEALASHLRSVNDAASRFNATPIQTTLVTPQGSYPI